MERSLSFGAVAEDYERYRPGYPDDLVTLIIEHAAGRVHRALEIGAGTGKATRVFARAGIEVTATEPDPSMLGVLRRECAGLPVRAEQKRMRRSSRAASRTTSCTPPRRCTGPARRAGGTEQLRWCAAGESWQRSAVRSTSVTTSWRRPSWTSSRRTCPVTTLTRRRQAPADSTGRATSCLPMTGSPMSANCPCREG
ncbi:class I SAM-dependent methyltransferase [Microlunatus endophyticus]